jgi:hypothetical protein
MGHMLYHMKDRPLEDRNTAGNCAKIGFSMGTQPELKPVPSLLKKDKLVDDIDVLNLDWFFG